MSTILCLQDPVDLCEVLTAKLEEGFGKSFDPVNHRFYTELKKCISDGANEESSPTGNDEEEDLVVDRVQKSLHCPITRKLLEKPVTSGICGHSYSREAIMGHIRRRYMHMYMHAYNHVHIYLYNYVPSICTILTSDTT